MKSLRLDVAVALVILWPFVTIGMDFRQSLIVQAAGILVIVVATIPALATCDGQRRILETPRPVLLGVAAVTIATIIGTIVGMTRGHAPAHIAGQTLSMGLLPLAAAGGLATRSDRSGKAWRIGLMTALTLGCWIQLAWGFVMIVILGEPSRLFLPNSVSVIGPALLGLCFSLASLNDSDSRIRRLAWTATLSILLVILGSSLRSLWILTPMTIVGLMIACRGLRNRGTTIALAMVTVLTATMIGGVWLLGNWAGKTRPDILDRTPCSLFPEAGECIGDGLEVVPCPNDIYRFETPVDLPEMSALQLKVRGKGEGQGAMIVVLLFLDDQGRELQKVSAPVRVRKISGTEFTIAKPPSGWAKTRLRLTRQKGSSGRWLLEAVECSAIGSPYLVPFWIKAEGIRERIDGLVSAIVTKHADADPSLGFRFYESRRAIEEIWSGSWTEILTGHGLGATLHLDVDGFDNRGNWIHYDEVNYLHNWYLFLLFKLGIAGAILVLGAIAAWILWTMRQIGRATDPDARAFLTAAATAWIVYAVWSLTSPEILDFRMAPLWGWLLSTSALKAVER